MATKYYRIINNNKINRIINNNNINRIINNNNINKNKDSMIIIKIIVRPIIRMHNVSILVSGIITVPASNKTMIHLIVVVVVSAKLFYSSKLFFQYLFFFIFICFLSHIFILWLKS